MQLCLADTCNKSGGATPPMHTHENPGALCVIDQWPHLQASLAECLCLCVGFAGRPCEPLSSPAGGSLACTVDALTGKVLTGNTCELTCYQHYTPSVADPTITCLDGAMDKDATCTGTLPERVVRVDMTTRHHDRVGLLLLCQA